MDLISLLVGLVILGVIFWLIMAYIIPLLPPPFRSAVTVILVLIVILILLSWIGVIPNLGNIRIGR